MKGAPPKPLPKLDEAARPYGMSGYSGVDAKELARRAQLARDVEMTAALFEQVCDRLVQGEPLVRICADRDMPSRQQVMRYIHKDEKAREFYYIAKEMQAETLSEEMMLIAADDSQDFSFDEKTGRRVSHNDVVARARLKTDVLSKHMASMAPKRFGNKTTTEVSGDPKNPVTINVRTNVPRAADSLIPSGLPAPKIIEGEVVKKSIKDD